MRTRGALAAVLALLALPAAAAAHGGVIVADGGNDAYTLTVQASDTVTASGEHVADLTAYPIRRSNGALDTDAHVVLTLDDGRTFTPRPRGDGLEVLIPEDHPGTWRDWRVDARVEGAAGTLRVTGTAAEPGRGAPGWLWPASAIALAGLLGLAVVVRRRRTPAGVSR